MNSLLIGSKRVAGLANAVVLAIPAVLAPGRFVLVGERVEGSRRTARSSPGRSAGSPVRSIAIVLAVEPSASRADRASRRRPNDRSATAFARTRARSLRCDPTFRHARPGGDGPDRAARALHRRREHRRDGHVPAQLRRQRALAGECGAGRSGTGRRARPEGVRGRHDDHGHRGWGRDCWRPGSCTRCSVRPTRAPCSRCS